MTETSASDLKTAVLECVDQAGDHLVAFPWENRNAYGNWLAQTYYFVLHTTSFLALTASRFGYWQRKRQYRQLVQLREESNHDLLALSDLEKIGLSVADFPELPETGALYQTQYYFIEHESPAAHFGYAYFLEGLAAKKICLFFDRLERSHPPDACQFLRVHMTDDPEHFEHGMQALDELSEAEVGEFQRNLRQSCYFYMRMLEHIQKLTT